MTFDFHISTFKANMSSAYNPLVENEVKRELLNYFLAYKSKVISNGSPCPSKTEEAIRHLQLTLKPVKNDTPSSKAIDWKKNTVKYFIIPIMVVIIGGFILHKITS